MMHCTRCNKQFIDSYHYKYCPFCGEPLHTQKEYDDELKSRKVKDDYIYQDRLLGIIKNEGRILNDLGYSREEVKIITSYPTMPIYMLLAQKGNIYTNEMYDMTFYTNLTTNLFDRSDYLKTYEKYANILQGKIGKSELKKEVDEAFKQAEKLAIYDSFTYRNPKVPVGVYNMLLPIKESFIYGNKTFYYYDKSTKTRITYKVEESLYQLYTNFKDASRFQSVAISYIKFMDAAYNICIYMTYFKAFCTYEDIETRNVNLSGLVMKITGYAANYEKYLSFYRYRTFAHIMRPTKIAETPFSQCWGLNLEHLKYLIC